jgi:alpha-tubulin suppressor-like RCC1 family protein
MPAIEDDRQAVQVASGDRHSITLYSDGTISASGNNAYGQLGDGTKTNRSEPVPVNGLSNVIAIAAGKWHSLAVTGEGRVWAWGDNRNRQLGNNTSEDALEPVLVVTQTNSGDLIPLTDVVAVAASEVHTVALKRDGTIWAWGDNRYGQLGTGNTFSSATAKPVPGLADVRTITAGGDATTARTMARTGDGALWGWGNNAKCQMGENTWELQTTPKSLPTLSRLGEIRALASGLAHGVALTFDGQVYTWGDNQHGQLGDGTSTSRCAPMLVSGVSQVQTIAAGGAHTLVTQSDGTIRAWGKNEYGQLGDGTASDTGQPAAVKGVCGIGQINLQDAPPATCPLTVEMAGGGTVGGGGDYAAETPVTLTATPNPGNVFMGWSPAPCAARFAMPASALVCTALFTDDPGVSYALGVAKTGEGAVSGGGSYTAGATVTLTATPVAGSFFVSWTPGPCATRFTMPARDLTCTATFTDDPATTLITHYYVSILEREPEPEGLAYWQELIIQKQAQGLDIKPVFRDMANFFFNSPEYLNRNTTDQQFITNLYLTFFQRDPDQGGLDFWLGQLASGMSRNDAMAGFLYAPEFTAFMESLGF